MRRDKLTNVIWGILFIIVGLGIAGNVMNLWEFSIFFPGWWTLFIIIPCALGIIREGFNLGNATGLVIGVLLLLQTRYDLIDFNIWKLTIPVILVLIGAKLLFQGVTRNRIDTGHMLYGEGANGNAPKGGYSAIFSSNNIYENEIFRGTNLDAIFGGIKLDLREAIIESDIEINATAVFGGIDIYLPENVNLKVRDVPIFGGVSQKRSKNVIPGAPVVYLNSTCMFGGIDIK